MTDTPTIACVVCHTGQRKPVSTTITLTRAEATLVFRCVPAEVCDTCGEAYLDIATTRRLEQLAQTAIAEGVRTEVRNYIGQVA